MFNKLNKIQAAFSILIALILLFVIVGDGFCARVATMGRKNPTSGEYAVKVDTNVSGDQTVTYDVNTARLFPYQSGTTNDTLTAADSGRTYVVTSGATSEVQLTLPAAAVGMVFSFVSATTEVMRIHPDGSDIINYASLSAGDSIKNTSAAKGDKCTFVCVTSNEWSFTPDVGTFADAN